MTGLGIFLIIVAALLLFLDPIIERVTQKEDYNGNVKPGIDLLKTTAQRSIVFAVALLGLVLAFNPFAENDSGNRQVVQRIGGELFVRFEPGFYYAGFFSKVTTYPNNVTIQVGPEEKRSADADYWTPTNTGTFAEGDQAGMGHTVKWDLPNQAPQMLELHTTYGSISNLATTTLMQYQRETASYSCQRMTSEEHYSGGQSQLKDYFQDQLRYGQVLLMTEEKVETQDDGKARTYYKVRPKLGDTGLPLRSPNEDISDLGLRPTFVSIDYIKYDDEIYEKLQTKIKFAAEEANSKQELVAAQQKEQTAIVKGREKIATVRAEQEAEELAAVIQARRAKLVAQEEALQAKFIADKIAEEGRAQAEANRALVSAGLTPEQRMKQEIEIAKVVAENISKAATPQVVIVGGSGGNGAEEALKVFGAERALELIRKMNNK